MQKFFDELRNDENVEISFIEEIQSLPISMTSTERKCYIEMGTSLYNMALDFFEKQFNLRDTI